MTNSIDTVHMKSISKSRLQIKKYETDPTTSLMQKKLVFSLLEMRNMKGVIPGKMCIETAVCSCPVTFSNCKTGI